MFTTRSSTRLASRRFVLAAASVVLLGLAACGDPNSTSSSSASIPVIHLAGGGSANRAEASGAPMEDSSKMMAPYWSVDYIFDGALPQLGDTGGAWLFAADAPVDLDRIAAMARTLGIEGDVRVLPADQGGGWMVGPEDFSGPTMVVGADGMQSWWFNPGPLVGQSGWTCAEPAVLVDPAVDVPAATSDVTGGGADGSTAAPPVDTSVRPIDPTCAEPQPPAGVPSEAEALDKAKELLASLDDSGTYEFDVYADEWNAGVTGWLVLDGIRSPISFSVGFGAEGAVTWASGSLAVPQRGADYPLVGPQAGLDRLNDDTQQWMWFGGYPGDVMRADAATTDVVVGTETVAPTPVGAPEPAPLPVDSVLIDPMPVEPMPVECGPAVDCAPIDQMPVTITLTDVTMGMTMVWAEDGTVWLLPAYSFVDADGGQYTVIAVDESFLDLPDPLPTPDTLPTIPVDTVVVDATVPPDTNPSTTDGVEPTTTEVPVPTTTG